tara:strand:- start:4459 stop:5247 length:789 start_codon:yes stop_codon:yes gene_type:complete
MKQFPSKNFIDLGILISSIKFIMENENRILKAKGLNFNWGIIWSMLNPLIIVIGFAILFSSGIRGQGRELEYFLFLILFWFGFTQIVNKIINFKKMDFFVGKKNLSDLVLMFSEYVSQCVPLFIRLLLCMFAMAFLNFKLEYYHLLYTFTLITLFAFGYGCICRTLFYKNDFLSEAHTFFLTGLFFISSIIIPVPLLPENIRDILLFNPIVHLFEWLKFPTTGIYYDFIDINYFINFLFAMLIIFPIAIKIYINRENKEKLK